MRVCCGGGEEGRHIVCVCVCVCVDEVGVLCTLVKGDVK